MTATILERNVGQISAVFGNVFVFGLLQLKIVCLK